MRLSAVLGAILGAKQVLKTGLYRWLFRRILDDFRHPSYHPKSTLHFLRVTIEKWEFTM
jgi:hypothetical protein